MLINVRDFGKGKQMTGLAIFLVILTAMDLVGYTVNKKSVENCGNKIH
jgi:hypothetical protein